ncbi:hypothetical protein ACVWXO_001899 [Bradyrhizobium sp. LM2.7]
MRQNGAGYGKIPIIELTVTPCELPTSPCPAPHSFHRSVALSTEPQWGTAFYLGDELALFRVSNRSVLR